MTLDVLIIFECRSGRHRSVAMAELVRTCMEQYVPTTQLNVVHAHLHHPRNPRTHPRLFSL